MPAIRGPETSLWRHDSDDRIEKTPDFVDDVGEPFVMSIGEIPLERGGLDGIDRQYREQDRVPAEGFLVRSNNAAASFGDCRCAFRRTCCHLTRTSLRSEMGTVSDDPISVACKCQCLLPSRHAFS